MFIEEKDEVNGVGGLEIYTCSPVAGGLPGCVFSKVGPPRLARVSLTAHIKRSIYR